MLKCALSAVFAAALGLSAASPVRAQNCAAAAECAGTLYCGGEWDFEAGSYFTGHSLAGKCEGPPGGGNISCVPSDKHAQVASGWGHWASFPTWATTGYWGVCSFNENGFCFNVHRGARSQELTMTCANGVGVIYKSATVPANHRIRVEAYMKLSPNGAAPDVEHAIGIDPSGGINPASPGVQWTVWQEHEPSPPQPSGVFNKGWAEAISLGPAITVMIRQRAFEPPCMGQTFLVDNVKVFDLGPNGPSVRVQPPALATATRVGTDAAAQTFDVSNNGTGMLTYTITDNVAWLSTSPTAGEASTETDEITVTYSTAALPVGTHTAVITITSPEAINPPQTVAITLTIRPKPADLDGDGDADQSDFGVFQSCFSGPGVPHNKPACAAADFNQDNDVDQDDFAVFQDCMGGANMPSDPGCTD